MRLGASIFSGDAAQGQPGFDDNVVTLWEAHGTWTPGRLELAALYANGHISNTSKVNITFIGNPTLIPESFYGWYGQAAYDLLDWDGNSVRPFVRFERLNTASNYSDLSPGLTPENGPDQDIITGGFSFLFAQGVVLKADYQHFHGIGGSDLDQLRDGISILMAEADRGVFGLIGAAALMMPSSVVVAADYLTIDAAQKAIFPSADSFEPLVLALTQRTEVRDRGTRRTATAAWELPRLEGGSDRYSAGLRAAR